MEAACNPLVASLYPENKTTKLNHFHLWFPGGIVIGGLLALGSIFLTTLSDVYAVQSLADLWVAHPLARILCEQPAIWAVPLSIVLMIVVSKATASTVPADVRMKMLVLHAPEALGLKQEYIKEHEGLGGH